MNNLSATQFELVVDKPLDVSGDRLTESARLTKLPPLSEPNFPEFGAGYGNQAQTTRITGRLIAAKVSEVERQSLLHERQALIDKVLDNTITRREAIRLEYVRWSLDRIEDAKHGQDMDELEVHIDRYENFLHDLDDFKDALVSASKRRK